MADSPLYYAMRHSFPDGEAQALASRAHSLAEMLGHTVALCNPVELLSVPNPSRARVTTAILELVRRSLVGDDRINDAALRVRSKRALMRLAREARHELREERTREFERPAREGETEEP